jgi:Reverse transcriptase (RNA-dependent DNA polymerase)
MADSYNSSQSWPLSQTTNKAKGTCSVCQAVRQLHLGDGLVHKHGPRDSPCLGSNKPPLAVYATHASSNTIPVAQASAGKSPAASCANQDLNPISKITHPSHNGGLIKHIPRGARPAVANLLVNIIDKITQDPLKEDAWVALLCFGGHTLITPSRGGRRHNIAHTIKKRVETFRLELAAGIPFSSPASGSGFLQKRQMRWSETDNIARAVSSKLEDGNIRAAVRILCSGDRPIQADSESLEELRIKHPPAENVSEPPHPPTNSLAFQTTEGEVLRAIRSFPAGSAGGPDGIRPQHILDLVNCREVGTVLLTSLTALTNILLAGTCPESITPLLFGGTLFALRKKAGGLRPIAIGYCWRRMASKCANAFALSRLSSHFAPLQLGVGTPGGCEAATHAARRFLADLPSGAVLVKLDFTNAFNSLSRTGILAAVSEHIPELYSYCHLSYSTPSCLKYGDYSLQSESGLQQGDPLGPLLFCLPIQSILSSLQSSLRIGYLDDVTLGGIASTVATDVQTIIREAGKMGLTLNFTKCEIINTHRVDLPPPLDSFTTTPSSEAFLLGAPLSTGALHAALEMRCAELSLGISRLSFVAKHDALILLRSSLSSPVLLHTLRCFPCMENPILFQFDQTMRTGLVNILNLAITDSNWLQATLPVRNGGLGIRRVSSLALPAFLASAAGTASLQASILSNCDVPYDCSLTLAQEQWQTESSAPFPEETLSHKQSAWDHPLILKDLAALEVSLTTEYHQARFRAVTSPHAGDWLLALPISTCGLRLNDEAVRIATGLRLGADLCVPHKCPCGAMVQHDGSHGMSCSLGPGRTARHALLNDIIWRGLNKAGFPATKEPNGLARSDGRRPDGVTLIPWEGGKCLAWDATVINTLAESYRSRSAEVAGAAAEIAADRKTAKYTAILPSYCFVPLAFETLGPINQDGLALIKLLGHRLAQITGDNRETTFLCQRISMSIQRFNAVAFCSTFPTDNTICED